MVGHIWKLEVKRLRTPVCNKGKFTLPYAARQAEFQQAPYQILFNYIVAIHLLPFYNRKPGKVTWGKRQKSEGGVSHFENQAREKQTQKL